MLTYVVTLNQAQLLDYCEHERIDSRSVRLVASVADMQGVDAAEDHLVFWGDCRKIPDILAILDLAMVQIIAAGRTFETTALQGRVAVDEALHAYLRRHPERSAVL